MDNTPQTTEQSVSLSDAIRYGMVQITWLGYTTSCNEYGFLWWRRWRVVAERGTERYEARHKDPLVALQRVWEMLPDEGDQDE